MKKNDFQEVATKFYTYSMKIEFENGETEVKYAEKPWNLEIRNVELLHVEI